MEIRDRVLVVEDDKRIGNFFRTVLEANHYDVIMAQTGAEAYSMVTSQCPDVVLLDLGLPDMDGMRILKSIREWSAMPVIVVSARTHERDKVEALDLGRTTILRSPSEPPNCWPGSVPPSAIPEADLWARTETRREPLSPAALPLIMISTVFLWTAWTPA